jgi:hypothetical protein
MGVRRREPFSTGEGFSFCSIFLFKNSSICEIAVAFQSGACRTGATTRAGFAIHDLTNQALLQTFRVSCGQIWDSTVLNGQT